MPVVTTKVAFPFSRDETGEETWFYATRHVPPRTKKTRKKKEMTEKKDGPISEFFNQEGMAAFHDYSLSLQNILLTKAILTKKPLLRGGLAGWSAQEPEKLWKEWFPDYIPWIQQVLVYTPKSLKEHPEYEEFDGNAKYLTLVSPDEQTFILLSGDIDLDQDPKFRWRYDINIESLNEEEFKRVTAYKSELVDMEFITQGSIHTLVTNQQGQLVAERLSFFEEGLIEENYNPEVVKSYHEVIEEMQKEVPFGRLTIISGPPGVGKSFLLRSMISELDFSLNVLIPSKMTGALDSPELLNILLGWRTNQSAEEYITFFIEDADQSLAPRMSDNISLISSLLNLTDGLFGTALNLRIVATTNAERPEFDEAMVRPGRLLKHIEVPKLTSKQAAQTYKKLTDGDEVEFKDYMTLAEVYARAYGKEQEKKTSKPIGFGQMD